VKFRPLHDRVVIRRLEGEEKTKAGIIIPDTAKEKPQEGIVIALGTGKTDDNGKKVPFEVKKGDRVLISKYGGSELPSQLKVDGKEYRLVNGDDILAVLE
jgi:chaperonin GroES